MLRFVLSAAFLLAAGPALAQASGAPAAQAPQTPTMTPAQQAIQTSAMSFMQCIQTGVRGLAATVTPEAGAATVLGGCASQKTQLEAAAQSYIATLPEDQRAPAQEHLRTQLGGVQAQIAAGIQAQRAAAAAPPAPAPSGN